MEVCNPAGPWGTMVVLRVAASNLDVRLFCWSAWICNPAALVQFCQCVLCCNRAGQ